MEVLDFYIFVEIDSDIRRTYDPPSGFTSKPLIYSQEERQHSTASGFVMLIQRADDGAETMTRVFLNMAEASLGKRN